jgi:hypothetical protein
MTLLKGRLKDVRFAMEGAEDGGGTLRGLGNGTLDWGTLKPRDLNKKPS